MPTNAESLCDLSHTAKLGIFVASLAILRRIESGERMQNPERASMIVDVSILISVQENRRSALFGTRERCRVPYLVFESFPREIRS